MKPGYLAWTCKSSSAAISHKRQREKDTNIKTQEVIFEDYHFEIEANEDVTSELNKDSNIITHNVWTFPLVMLVIGDFWVLFHENNTCV